MIWLGQKGTKRRRRRVKRGKGGERGRRTGHKKEKKLSSEKGGRVNSRANRGRESGGDTYPRKTGRAA